MEFKLKERPLFEIKLANTVKLRKKLLKFMEKYRVGFDVTRVFGGMNKGNGKQLNEVLYAEEKKGIIGVCAIVNYGEGLVLCYYLSVLKGFRRQTVGTSLLNAVFNYAHGKRVHNILSFSESSNKPAKKLLKKTGFRKIGKIKRFFGKKDYIMWEYLP